MGSQPSDCHAGTNRVESLNRKDDDSRMFVARSPSTRICMEHAPRRSALAKTNEGRPCSSRPWCVSRRPDFALLNGTATENRDGADNEHPKLVPPYLTKHLFRKGPFWGQIEWTRQRLFVSRVMSPSLPPPSIRPSPRHCVFRFQNREHG